MMEEPRVVGISYLLVKMDFTKSKQQTFDLRLGVLDWRCFRI